MTSICRSSVSIQPGERAPWACRISTKLVTRSLEPGQVSQYTIHSATRFLCVNDVSPWEIYLHLVNVYGARVMRCGCGRMISTTAGQTLTTRRDPDAQARLLRMTACVVQVSVADRTQTWSPLTWPESYIYFTGYWAQNCPRPSRLRRGLCTVCTQAPHTRRKGLPFRTSVLQLTLYASHRELFVLCTFTGIKSGLITRNTKPK